MGLRDPLFLGLDVGTQSTKGVVISSDPTRGILAQATAPHRMVGNLPPEHREQDPEQWLDAIASVCRRLFGADVDASGLRGIGVSGQQHGAVLLDEQDRVVRPAKLWCDTATVAEAEDLSRLMGRHIPCGYTASKVA